MEPAKPNARKAPQRFSAEYKAQVLNQCEQPGALITHLAAQHGLRLGLLHKWRQRVCQVGQFVGAALAHPASGQERQEHQERQTPPIHIDIQRPGGGVHIRWPANDAAQCGHWLKAWHT